MFKQRRDYLPDATIYGLIGGIPETFGGRTGVCLHRADTFAELGDRDVEVLTLSPANGVDPEALTTRLRAEGRIGKRVTIRNIWSDLRRADDRALAEISKHSTEPITIETTELPVSDGSLEVKSLDSKGKTRSCDRFRENGSRFHSYRLGDENVPKSTVLFDSLGRPIAQWKEQYELYFAWLDWVVGSHEAIIINDGPPLARYLYKYQRKNVTLVQTIHSKHSADPTKRSERLGRTYTPALKHADRFDLVAILTEAQRFDLIELNFVMDNASVLPNMTGAVPIRHIRPRPAGAGVMLARTTFLKRIDHAISAVHRVQQTGTAATFEIYGVADEAQESLESLVADVDVGGKIALKGYDPRARQKFEEASFTLLTSEYEGQPLVLLESMAAGCIPIAYDIKYGPADIITPGVNGFLVPDGDIDALARCINNLISMEDQALMRMRAAAVQRSKDFSPEKITRLWGTALTRAVADKTVPVDVEGRAELVDIRVSGDEIHLRVTLSKEAADSPDWALLSWTERKGLRFGRLPARIELVEGRTQIVASAHIDDFAAVDHGFIDLWIDLRVHGNPCQFRVKGANNVTPQPLGHAEVYGTRYGSLSIRFPVDTTASDG